MRLIHSTQLAAARPSQGTADLIQKVSAKSLQGFVEALAYPRHYVAQAEANRRAAGQIAEVLASFGYEVQRQGFYGNVVALPRGYAGPLTLVGSHYDTVPATPGADDNGSAIAGMLECARVLAGRGAPVGFVSFNCEEDGLLGSAEFVKDWVPGYRGGVVAVHVLEMIGFASSAPGSQRVPPGLPITLPDRGDFLGLLSNQDSGALLDATVRAARAAVPEFPVIGLDVPDGAEQFFPVLLRSDHAPFWDARIPALMWTDTSEFRNANYHQSTDTPDTLDYEFLANVTRALVASVLPG